MVGHLCMVHLVTLAWGAMACAGEGETGVQEKQSITPEAGRFINTRLVANGESSTKDRL